MDKKELKKNVLSSIAGAAKFVAALSPNTLSGIIDYEPKMPENLQQRLNMSSKQK